MKFKLALIGTFCVCTIYAQTPKIDTIRVMTYNLLNFPDGRNDCGNSNLLVPNRHDTLAKVINYSLPDIFIANEIQSQRGADSILIRSLNINGRTHYRMAEFAYGNAGGFPHNAIFYNSEKLILKEQHIIPTSVRPIDHIVFYGVDPLLSTHYDTTFFEVFAAHLKAGSASDNVQERYQQALIIRDYVDARPAGRNYIIGGDFNVYRSSEAGYVKLTTGGTRPFLDPINRPGSWNSNNSFRAIHTQSTRNNEYIECGSTGGMDDRFDQILVSANVLNGADSVRYITNSYITLGNDGNHYNQSLINGSNSMYPMSLVRSLYYMSDHLPVTMDLRVKYPLTNGLALQPIIRNIDCNGAQNGRIEIIAHAGQGPYTYSWAHNSAFQSNILDNLSPGEYCVTITDALNQVDNICVTVGEPSAMTAFHYAMGDEGNCTGSAVVFTNDGVAPYTYSWSNNPTVVDSYVSNLCEGEHVVTIMDANGCTITLDINILPLSTLEGLALQNVEVYPNPTSDEVTVKWTGNAGVEFEVVDLLGKVCEIELMDNQAFNHTISLVELQAGVYIIRAKGTNWNTRIVKQ